MTEYVRARVTGRLPIRDAATRESVPFGGEVRLLARQRGTGNELCARHPRSGIDEPKQPCTCGSAVVELLVAGGHIELIPEEKSKGKP
jgi:hypothetical protein